LSYKKKALTGVLWSSIQSFGTQSVSFVISIVLARLLLPEEFGLIAMITAFLLANGNFETLINEARAIYDYIIIDLAPTILVTDTLLIPIKRMLQFV